MSTIIADGWTWFCIAFSVVLFTSYLMNLQQQHFYTMDVVERKFTIMDLQFAANAKELAIIIKGIDGLQGKRKEKAVTALKAQLYIDFLFMAAAYSALFILCLKVSGKLSLNAGKMVFVVFAWCQLIAWMCDFAENVYLLNKIRSNIIIPEDTVTASQEKVPQKEAGFSMYGLLVFIKWGLALTGGVCSVFAFIYFWLAGEYERSSLQYLLIIAAELILFIVAGRLSAKRKNKELAS